MRTLTTLTAAAFLTTACGVDADLDAPDAFAPLDTDEGVVLDVPAEDDEALEDTGFVDDDQPLLAEADFDNADDPLDHVRFTPTAAREAVFADEISFPGGDREDFWSIHTVASENHVTRITVELVCEGETDGVVAELLDDDGFSFGPADWTRCNQGPQDLTVDSNTTYLFRVVNPHGEDAGHVDYTLYVTW